MWSIITSVLYLECGIVSLLVLPIVSLNQWQQLIHSHFMVTLSQTLKPWIYSYVCLLTCIILNSLRLMHQSLDADIAKDDEKLLQFNFQQALAQRNFYISAASLFLLALARRLVLMKMNQMEELDDFLNFGVEYKPGRREPEVEKLETSSARDLSIAPVMEDAMSYNRDDDIRKWADLDEWTSRMRRITASLVREEKNNEVLQHCAQKLSNFCMRLDEDYQHIQEIIGTVENI